MMAMNAMHRRYWFTDVHVRGKYPQHLLNYFERRGFALDITEEDKVALTQGCVDYIGFSYYMSFATKATADNPTLDYDESKSLVSNPYVQKSDWGWQNRSCRAALLPELVLGSLSAAAVYCGKRLWRDRRAGERRHGERPVPH